MWELRYFVGGRDLQRSLGEHLVVGESFAFLRPGWAQSPLIASILKAAGVQDAPGRVFPLWGDDELEIPGGVLVQQPVPALGFCSLWTDRQLYREHRDPIRVFIYTPHTQQSDLRVSIWCEGKLLDRQPVVVDSHGLCQLELQSLPAGRYRLVVGGDQAETSFTIAHARICTLSGNWLQCYSRTIDQHRSILVFVLQLESFGQPIQDEFQVQLFDEGRQHAVPVGYQTCRSDGGGRIAGELTMEGTGPFTIEIQSFADPAKWSLMDVPLEGTEAFHEKAQLIGPLGPIHSWQWDQGEGVMGLRIEKQETSSTTPVVLDKIMAQQAVLQVHEPIESCTVTVLDIVRGEMEMFQWPALYEEQTITVPVPSPMGVITIGGFVRDMPWEGWTVAIAPPSLQLSLTAQPRRHLQDPLELRIQTNKAEEVPVFVLVKEDVPSDDQPPWGPADTMIDLADEILPDLFFGTPSEPLWRSNDHRTQRPSIGKPSQMPPPPGASPRTSIGPPSSVPPPSTPPPEMHATPEPSGPTRLPPQSEDFPDVLFAAVIPVTQERSITLPPPEEQGDYRIEAVALDGTSWSYATAEVALASPTFCELLIPPHAHPENTVLGEAVIMTDQPQIFAELWRDQTPVPMFVGETQIHSQTPLTGPLVQIQINVIPGHYTLRVLDTHGNQLDWVEADVHPWGIAFQEGWGLQLLPVGSHWTAPQEEDDPFTAAETGEHALVIGSAPPKGPPLTQAMAIPHLVPMIRQVAAELLHRPPDHCETEAARIAAILFTLPYADNIHHAAQLSQHLQQSLDRLLEMFVPMRGFKLYPDLGHEPEWGMEALRHLWDILWLDRLMEQSGVGYGRLSSPQSNMPWRNPLMHLMDEATAAYNTSVTPTRMVSIRDACRVFLLETTPARREEALWEVQKRLVEGDDHRLYIQTDNLVFQRQEGCYAAITLLASSDGKSQMQGLYMANDILKAWPSVENSYSTKEGIALLALLEYCQRFLLQPGHTSAMVNNEMQAWSELSQPIRVKHIEVQEGIAPLGFFFPRMPKDLTRFTTPTPWHISLYKPDNPQYDAHEVELGSRLHLQIVLDSPPEVGDHLELYLPPCLAWLDGERHEKQFAVPMYPNQQVELPLVAITTTVGMNAQMGIQHWGVRLSNQYNSARGNAAFNNSIVVWGPGQRRRDTQNQWLNRWRKIFG